MGSKGSKEKNKKDEKKPVQQQQQQPPQKQVQAQAQPQAAPPPQKAAAGGFEDDDHEEVADGGERAGDFKGDDTPNTDSDEAYSFWDRNKTYKPERKLANNKQQGLQKTMKATMKATLGGGELKKAVQLPEGEDMNEWIAVNTVHFFNAASMIYGTCRDFCTDQSCSQMSAGKAEYLWKDNGKYKKPTRLAAPQYIDLLLSWIDEQIANPQIFPVDEHAKFPRNFMSVVKNIYKRLFRLYAHLYYSHHEKIKSIGANAHLNTCFKHFIYFVLEFNLIDEKDLAPLSKFIAQFRDDKQK